LSLSEEDKIFIEKQLRGPFWFRLITFFGAFVLLILLCLVFFAPEVLLSKPVGFLAGLQGDYYSSLGLVEIVGSNIQRNCGGEFYCVVDSSLLFVFRGVVYEWADAVNFVNPSDLTVLQGGNCKDKALVFCGVVLESNFRCQVISVIEENHAFNKVFGNQGEVVCLDSTSGFIVDCNRLVNGVVLFDSKELSG